MERNTENITYGKSLQEIRKKNNLTQEQVSQLTGLETKYISQIECGIAKGTINTMLKFCEAYNVIQDMIFYINLFKNLMQKKIQMNMKKNL